MAGQLGLVIGRFMPPHFGHRHLLGVAAGSVDRLVVLVMAREGEPVPGDLRAAWLQDMCPQAEVVLARHDLPTDFSDAALWDKWMALIRGHLDRAPDVVFSSEPYGDELARRFGADNVCVDPDRTSVDISATRIREDPLAHLAFLPEAAAEWYRSRAE